MAGRRRLSVSWTRAPTWDAKEKALAFSQGLLLSEKSDLHVERRTAAAGALHVRVLELESCAFQGLKIVDSAAV